MRWDTGTRGGCDGEQLHQERHSQAVLPLQCYNSHPPQPVEGIYQKCNADLAEGSTKIFLKGRRGGAATGDIDGLSSFLKDEVPNMTCSGLRCMYFQNIKTQTAFYGQTRLEAFQSGP